MRPSNFISAIAFLFCAAFMVQGAAAVETSGQGAAPARGRQRQGAVSLW